MLPVENTHENLKTSIKALESVTLQIQSVGFLLFSPSLPSRGSLKPNSGFIAVTTEVVKNLKIIHLKLI